MFGHRKRPSRQRTDSDLRCSFCYKSQNDVRKLIAGPTVFICDECVAVCNDILLDDVRWARAADAAQPGSAPSTWVEAWSEPSPAAIPASQTDPERGREHASYPVMCAMCGLPVAIDEAVGVAERGFLCAGCVSAVEAALAERNSHC